MQLTTAQWHPSVAKRLRIALCRVGVCSVKLNGGSTWRKMHWLLTLKNAMVQHRTKGLAPFILIAGRKSPRTVTQALSDRPLTTRAHGA